MRSSDEEAGVWKLKLKRRLTNDDKDESDGIDAVTLMGLGACVMS